jgi:hypothetical protein
LKDS